MKFENRNRSGAIALFVAALSMLVLLIGFFAAELWQANLVLSQLRNCCDAASMAAALRLVSAHEKNSEDAERAAQGEAEKIFRLCSVMGYPLADAERHDSLRELGNLAAGKAAFAIQFQDEFGNLKIGGKHIHIQAAFGTAPFSSRLLGLGTYLLKAEGRSAAAKLDLAFCLDNSLSMATDTPIALIRRELKSSGSVGYSTPLIFSKASQANTCGVVEPQYLGNLKQYSFSRPMRGPAEAGTLPGQDLNAKANTFTDRVVLVDNSEFSNPLVALEAMRGNLENKNVFESSGAKDALAAAGVDDIRPAVGMKQKYMDLAAPKIQPFTDAKSEVKEFFRLMERNTDSHFALIPFSDGAASVEGGKYEQFPVYSGLGKKQSYPFGKVELARDNSKFDKVMTEIDTYSLYGGTDIPAAIREATKSLSQNGGSRSDARKAILLFTDGEPYSKKYADPAAESIAAAEEAKKQGITIYTVGFLHDGSGARAKTILQRIASDHKSFIVQEIEQLHDVFRYLARELVTLE
ncbi:MAG: VWA domain-containing protein [Candidatus Obscuribacterales bacterium]|nr:VWA domain-containing protein [Candidatus Obscuribacterales bacterium]